MNEEDQIKEKIYNIYLLVEDLKTFPHTYNTILKDEIKNTTIGTILRRKLNKLCKQGEVCKTTIPGTRFGKVIFYHEDKEYYLLFVSDRVEACKVYCFFNFKRKGRYYIEVEDYWELKKNLWVAGKNETFFEGNTLKFI